jgi:signal transduction histidine kinase
MKKRIVIGLIAYSLVFLVGGGYLVYTIEDARGKLDRLITLHQVEILREHYLIQIKKVQADLLLRDTPYARKFDLMVSHIRGMGHIVGTCFDCHHKKDVAARIEDLWNQTQRYENALSRMITIRANAERMSREEENAFRIGEELTEKVGNMIAFTSSRLGERTQQALDDIGRTKNLFYLLMASIPMLSGILVIVLIRGMTRPMETLLQSTQKLTTGDLDHRIEGLKDEFGELGGSINVMAGSLKEQIRKIEQAREELAKSNQELKTAQEQMVRAETMASIGTLSAGISHELSTPLSTILNMVQLVKQDIRQDSPLAKDLAVIEFEANQAIKITRSLLGFARTSRTKADPVNVNEVMEDLFKILEFQPQAKTITLVKDLEATLGPIQAGAGPLRQVFLNVFLNAVQAMPDGGELRVATRNIGDGTFEGVQVTISDTGTGIPEEEKRQIFQPFFTTKEQGTGLGLAIAYGIVQEHNGKIEVESEVGKGTTFRIFLPAGLERAT